MANQSSVNREHMAQAATKVNDAHGQINGVKNELNAHHSQLQSQWKGESSAAFTEVFGMFQQEFAKVLKDLNDIHEKLVHTKVKYEQAEQEKTQKVNHMKGLVNG
ncbi:WXG100 family type VII secretion target [Actinomadura barringtoniae]|uniref:ESAT-6-like protein n=1 Tax=Actinomadura barringtoniae TaxID=1427535 RepID=A0A939P8G6_9ACTN|nr:WXG100 family type VII secretion target [Actinomadura barringtoniae]MBO2447272.1 WXG100 family type VII secretion target [Actinomadura barringtoniae]